MGHAGENRMRPRILRDLGYQIAPAMFEHDDRPTVFWVSGHGVQTYLPADNVVAYHSLIRKALIEKLHQDLVLIHAQRH